MVELNAVMTCDGCGDTHEPRMETNEVATEGYLPHIQPHVPAEMVIRVVLKADDLSGWRRIKDAIYCAKCAPLAASITLGSDKGKPLIDIL